MKRYLLTAVAMVLAFILLGCAGYSGLKGKSGSESITALELRVAEEDERQNERIKAIDAYIGRMGEGAMGPMEKQELINRIAILESKVNNIERRNQVSIRIKEKEKSKEEEKEEKEKSRRASIRIKVLSGDRDPTSAKRMAMRLQRFGYKVERTDIATKSNFRETRIFYSSGHRDDAEEMAVKLDAVVKPLTWQSVFDIIVVTGKAREFKTEN